MTRPGSVSVQRGITLVEMLIAMAIVGIILSVVAAFFGLQARVSRDTQARNEINVRTRAVLEAIVQDVKMSGARAVVDGAGRAVLRSQLDCDAGDTCLIVTGASDGQIDTLRLEYISSLFLTGLVGTAVNATVPAEACRRVLYTLQDGTLFRSDVACDVADEAPGFATELADGIAGIRARFACGPDDDGVLVSAAAECFADGGFVREVQIVVSATTTRPQGITLDLASATTTPNLRSFSRFAEAAQ